MNVEPPSNMHSGPIKLIFEKIIDVEPGGKFVPFYHFKITVKEGTKVGHINFKVAADRWRASLSQSPPLRTGPKG